MSGTGAAVDELDLFAQSHAPDLTHGICAECYASFSGALDLGG